MKSRGSVTLRGRGGGALERNFSDIVAAIADELPDDSIVDGEIIVVGAGGAQLTRCSTASPFRHATRFVRWRPDLQTASCDETQLPDR